MRMVEAVQANLAILPSEVGRRRVARVIRVGADKTGPRMLRLQAGLCLSYVT